MLPFRKYIFLLFLTTLFFSCCKDKDDNTSTASYDYGTVESYTYFLPGTYWVYRDTISGVEDCVYVNHSEKGIDTVVNGGTTNYYNHFNVETQSTFYSYSFEYYVESQWTLMWHTITVWRDKYKPGDFVGSTFLCVFPLKLNKSYRPFTQYGSVMLIKTYDSLEINNLQFKGVIKFNDTKNRTEGESKTNFYLAKQVGIIRKEIIDSARVWDLVRFNILQ